MDSEESPIIRMEGITKRFGRVIALSDVDIELRENEVMGLVGDNGSGKSTLIKTLVGVHRPDAGSVSIRGERVKIHSPEQARAHGISTVYQDLALVNELSVATNMFLDRYPRKQIGRIVSIVDWDTMNDEAARILRERMNLDIDPTAKVEFLSGGERQAIAIGRALVTDPDIVVMDEPTSALSPDSAERVIDLVDTLREEGLSVIIIDHNLDEVFSVTDRLTVLRNGNHVATVDSDSVSEDEVVQMMVQGKAAAPSSG